MKLIIENAQRAFKTWKKVPFEQKQKLLKKLADALLANKNRYAEMMTQEMGKPISQSLAEIEKCALLCQFYADCKNVLATQKIESEFAISEIHHQPLGAILGVMPWNFPFWQALRFIVPTVLAGNVVILKHASICLESGDAIENLFLEVGFPKGVLQHQKLTHDEVAQLMESPVVQGASLTGSELAGRKIAETAGRNLKKVVLELGGNDAFIVCQDADLKVAAENAAKGRLHNYGQTCISAKRFIVHEKIYDEFLTIFKKEYEQYKSENPMDKATFMSEMAREDLADELENQYRKAIENGAEVILPLERTDKKTFQQGLIAINMKNPMADEEFFGPLGMVLKGKNDEKLLAIANDTSFGLGNSVWTKDRERAMFFAENLESGTVAINQVTKSDPRFPFGGVKNSGYGLELSTHALKEFVSTKTILGVNI